MAKKESKKETKTKKHFFKDFKAELKKVIWPTPKQLVNNTIAVVTIVLITAAIVFVLDVTFDFMNKYGISNLQNKVDQTFNNQEEQAEGENNSEEPVEETENQETENTTNDTSTEEQISTENTSSENSSTETVEENTETNTQQ